MRSRRTILIVGQASQKTGLARITRAIATSLVPHYDVHVLGIDAAEDGQVDGWTLHRNPRTGDPFAEYELTEQLDALRPDAVLLYNDLWVIDRYHARIAEAKHRCPVAGYCPIDGPLSDPALLAFVAPLDELVVFTEFARNIVRDGDPHRSVHVIPHGIDTAAFHPLPRAARDGFTVLNANRNQPRKRLDITLQGFAKFAANKPANVRLWLHCGLTDIGIDILGQARLLDISDRVIFTHERPEHPDVSTRRLNEIYNACDVGVNTAIGEGWGLVACEHAATGAAQIVPRHSACAEIWDGAADFLEPVEHYADPFLQGGIVDANDLADCLERLYSDPEHRHARARAAYERITSPRYSWTHIGEQWRALFARMLTGIANSSSRR